VFPITGLHYISHKEEWIRKTNLYFGGHNAYTAKLWSVLASKFYQNYCRTVRLKNKNVRITILQQQHGTMPEGLTIQTVTVVRGVIQVTFRQPKGRIWAFYVSLSIIF
jgi:hypothetical protein